MSDQAEDNEYEPVGFGSNPSSSSEQLLSRPRPRPRRSVQNQHSESMNQENTENERRLLTGTGEVYEPMWMSHSASDRDSSGPIFGRSVSTPTGQSSHANSTARGAGATSSNIPALPHPATEHGDLALPVPTTNDRFQRSASQQDTVSPQRLPSELLQRFSASSPGGPASPRSSASVGAQSPHGAVGGVRPLPPLTPATDAALPVVSDDPFPMSPGYDLSNLPEKLRESLGVSDDVYGWNVPPEDETGAPPPYIPRNAFNLGAQKSLKQSQVEVLEKEMSHTGGVKVMLRRIDCHQTIAFVDFLNKVWIAGWNQKARPFLHSAFHVGDRLVCINGQVIENSRMARKLIKHCSEEDKMTFIIKRVPFGKIFAVRRSEEGQDLGIKRDGGTGEIVDVEPFGLAARHGLTAKTQVRDGTNLCNWFLTEINSRPVNLFYKGDEIERRLNAVGKDISFLVQPVEFIDTLKKEMKKNIKNYKDFVVQ